MKSLSLSGDNDKSIDEVSVIINQSLEEFFPEKHVRIIAEPGRYYVASAFTLTTNVHSKKNIHNPLSDQIEGTMLYINDGVYASFNCLLYDHQVVKPKLLKHHSEGEKTMKTTIFGPTCDALDEILVGIDMPESIDLGDFIYFENMGAYTIPVASPFNGFPLPKVFHFIEREMWQMVRSMIPVEADERFIEDFIGKTIEVVSTSA
jgi:ornithine decarboxylase